MKDSPFIPIDNYEATEDYAIETVAVIECTMGKTHTRLGLQLPGYIAAYTTDAVTPMGMVVNAGPPIATSFVATEVSRSNLALDLAQGDASRTLARFVEAVLH